jgi:predicted permease
MINDIRYALRMMAKSPAFTAIAVLSLALGIGANTAIFTLVDNIMLKLLPVKDPQQLYMVAMKREGSNVTWSHPDYAAFREFGTGFDGLAAYSSNAPYGLIAQGDSSDQQAAVAGGVLVSGNYFEVLGVQAALGRRLNMEDDRRPGGGPSLVLSHAFWQRRFQSDPRVIGTKVRVNGFPMTVVGVARNGFTGTEVGASPDFFAPATMRGELMNQRDWNNRNNSWLQVIGRKKPGVSIVQIENELSGISSQQAALDRKTAVNQRFVNPAYQVALQPGAQGQSRLRNQMSQPLLVLMIVVGFVLLIACANVANLLLARAAGRRREIAVRLAVGASRSRLIRQLLVESTLLSVAGAALGMVLALYGAEALMSYAPNSGWNAAHLDLSPDSRVLGFTVAVALLTGILFGLAPAFQASRTNVGTALKDDTAPHRMTLRKALVVAQVALSLLLLVGAGLFMRSLQNLRNLHTGFRQDHVLVIGVDAARGGYKGQRLREFYERLRARIEALPGVRIASLARITPLGGSRWNYDARFEGYPHTPEGRDIVYMNAVGPRALEALGIPIIAGRDFREEDNPPVSSDPPAKFYPGYKTPEELEGPKVAIISESVAKKYFPNRNPIGMRVSLDNKFDMATALEIVGVVKEAKYFGLRNMSEGMIYMPGWRPGASSRSVVVNTSIDPAALTEQVRREIAALDNTIPLLSAKTMRQNIDENIVQERLVATLSSLFGVLALILAAIGLYGVLAQTVTGRTREIGIRMALGARRGNVLWLILRDAAWMVLIGAAVGIPAAIATTRFAGAMLYGIKPGDPISMVIATVVLLSVAALAAFVPSRRASKVDPMVALRYE